MENIGYGLTAFDTIVVPAHPQGFNEVFINKRMWPNLKMDTRRRNNIKFIAVYQTKPVSAITHYAEIKCLETLETKGRFNVFLSGEVVEIEPVRFTNADICALQGPRYTNLQLILSAKHLSRAFPN